MHVCFRGRFTNPIPKLSFYPECLLVDRLEWVEERTWEHTQVYPFRLDRRVTARAFSGGHCLCIIISLTLKNQSPKASILFLLTARHYCSV